MQHEMKQSNEREKQRNEGERNERKKDRVTLIENKDASPTFLNSSLSSPRTAAKKARVVRAGQFSTRQAEERAWPASSSVLRCRSQQVCTKHTHTERGISYKSVHITKNFTNQLESFCSRHASHQNRRQNLRDFSIFSLSVCSGRKDKPCSRRGCRIATCSRQRSSVSDRRGKSPGSRRAAARHRLRPQAPPPS